MHDFGVNELYVGSMIQVLAWFVMLGMTLDGLENEDGSSDEPSVPWSSLLSSRESGSR
jgi:hypothetical protein